MPRYKTKVNRWLSHECRAVKAGEEFTTTFPKVKNAEGKEVDMKLGATLELLPDPKPGAKPAEGEGKGGADLAG